MKKLFYILLLGIIFASCEKRCYTCFKTQTFVNQKPPGFPYQSETVNYQVCGYIEKRKEESIKDTIFTIRGVKYEVSRKVNCY